MPGQYKTLHQTAEIAELLRELSGRIEHMESRLDVIERQLSSPMGMAVHKPTPPSPQLGLSVSGSSTPTAISSGARELMLAPADEQIVSLIRAKGAVCASEVRVNLRYKGNNAASARLNRLFELGILEKTQAGRVVYYKIRE